MFKRIFSFSNLLLMAILLIALFFRVYKLDSFYIFEHDQDLYSWIVKDIWVDHHFRLIGQLTSIEGIFIGPLFYYLLVPFFVLFQMNPLGATVPMIIIGLLTVLSFYYIGSRLFNQKTGLIAAFIYSISLSMVLLDRWVVPTQPTVIWSVWYFYVLFSLAKGNPKVFPLLGILLGLVWHIHVGLLPLVLLIPVALLVARTKIQIKQIGVALFLFLIFSAPFWIFEVRHDYQQIQAFFSSLGQDKGELQGLPRIQKIFDAASGAFVNNFLWGVRLPIEASYVIFVGTIAYLRLKKMLSSAQVLLIILWIVVNFLSHFVSKRSISEYYFNNIITVSVFVIALLLTQLTQYKEQLFVYFIVSALLAINIYWLVTMSEYQAGFKQKQQVAQFIATHARDHNYSCIGVNYIAEFGTAVGFRYLLWLNNTYVIRPGIGAPSYNIVIPWFTAKDEIDQQFGIFGVILPEDQVFSDKTICGNAENQLIPMLGFTK